MLIFFEQPSENLYEQKPEEPPPVVVPSSAKSIESTPRAVTLSSRFEYSDNFPSNEASYGGLRVTGHVAPPPSSNFFSDFDMDGGGFTRKASYNPPKINVSKFVTCFFTN